MAKPKAPPLYYTTEVDASKTVSELQQLLTEYGASSVSVEYATHGPTSITFVISINGASLHFLLEPNTEAVFQNLKVNTTKRYQTREQAFRTAWRQLKGYVVGALAFTQTGQGDVTKVLFEYMLTGGRDDKGALQTTYQTFTQKLELGE